MQRNIKSISYLISVSLGGFSSYQKVSNLLLMKVDFFLLPVLYFLEQTDKKVAQISVSASGITHINSTLRNLCTFLLNLL